ncbi:hypothetical protein ZWY2020_019078 [Hordeum vulgare]|nr:hypothetical protein ZWY2020_019078 [Hordeum vulgare]
MSGAAGRQLLRKILQSLRPPQVFSTPSRPPSPHPTTTIAFMRRLPSASGSGSISAGGVGGDIDEGLLSGRRTSDKEVHQFAKQAEDGILDLNNAAETLEGLDDSGVELDNGLSEVENLNLQEQALDERISDMP